MVYKYIYGPVLSRRLGNSLGIDIIPFKYCSFNCIYCQIGRTTSLAVSRDEYTPTGDILAEIKHAVTQTGKIDYLTFSGSGEPTLHSRLGFLITEVMKFTDIPIALLTNSSLIDRADVQQDILGISVIAPTLCTVDQSTFQKIHRGHDTIQIRSIIQGLIAFRKRFTGEIWLELMLIKGINDSDKEIQELKAVINEIHPDKIHLNTVVRPPSESWVSPVPYETLEHIRSLIKGNTEIITRRQKAVSKPAHRNIDRRICAVIERRPLTLEDIASITAINMLELVKHMERLQNQGKVKLIKHGDAVFYEIDKKEEK